MNHQSSTECVFNEMQNLRLLANYDFLDLCLLGETGTGKTHAAQIVHEASPRAEKPFVAVNCAELSNTLVESELFGYEKGAFTGAINSKPGKFEAAGGGTLFLDEIGELTTDLQAKLLKAVEEKRITRVGSNVARNVNVRIIYATHRDLTEFREDLRYRIAAHPVWLAPLRERREQILPLARIFLEEFSRKANRKIAASDETLKLLENCEWRGNVRELRHVVERACLEAIFVADQRQSRKSSQTIVETVELTPPLLLSRLPDDAKTIVAFDKARTALRFSADYKNDLANFDRDVIVNALSKTAGNVARAARELGLSRYGLIKKMKRYGIEPNR